MKKEKLSVIHEVCGFDGIPMDLTDEDVRKLEEAEEDEKNDKK